MKIKLSCLDEQVMIAGALCSIGMQMESLAPQNTELILPAKNKVLHLIVRMLGQFRYYPILLH